MDRRRLLRQRKELAIRRDAIFMVKKCRRRAKQTFDEIVVPKNESPQYNISFNVTEKYFNNLYSQELSTNIQLGIFLPLLENAGNLQLRSITEQDVVMKLNSPKCGSSAGSDEVSYDI